MSIFLANSLKFKKYTILNFDCEAIEDYDPTSSFFFSETININNRDNVSDGVVYLYKIVWQPNGIGLGDSVGYKRSIRGGVSIIEPFFTGKNIYSESISPNVFNPSDVSIIAYNFVNPVNNAVLCRFSIDRPEKKTKYFPLIPFPTSFTINHFINLISFSGTEYCNYGGNIFMYLANTETDDLLEYI